MTNISSSTEIRKTTSKNLKKTKSNPKSQSSKKKKLLITKQCSGADISQENFVASYQVLDSLGQINLRGLKKFSNTLAGFKLYKSWLEKHLKKSDAPLSIVMEATGVYYENLAHFLHEAGFEVIVLLPNKAKAFALSLNAKSKTDPSDAKILSRMGLERSDLTIWQSRDSDMLSLKKKSRQRTRLVASRTAIKNQLSAEKASYQSDDKVMERDTQRITLINQQIKAIEKEMIALFKKSDLKTYEKMETIAEIKGIGILTVMTIVIEANGFKLFKNIRQLLSYAGYDVVENQSGKFTGKTKISKKGNKHIRRALHMPALSVVQNNPDSVFAQLYQRVFERTTIKMKGYVAVQRKILTIIYTLFQKDQAYDADFHKKACETPKIADSI